MSKFIININGEIHSKENAKISVLDRGFLYGDSVYEALRTFNKVPLRLNLHLDRLFESAQKIYFSPKLSKETIKQEVLKTIESGPYENANIRIVLTRGTNQDLGLNPDLSDAENLIIYLKELTPNPDWWYTAGINLTTFQKETSSKGSLPKTGNYIENMLAHRKALKNNFYDSIMINNDGFVTECTTSNIWLIKDQTIYTPSLDEGVLPGLTRSTILSMSPFLKYKMVETKLVLKDFLKADECFITSTTREIVPVKSIENQLIGKNPPGPITKFLIDEYRKTILKDLNLIN
jgi:branched-chain amino acid aminotransferase